ncbi:DUF5765 domain-containing protein [Methylomonas sp. MED-D]|uniref:Uncharacterized protein n=1 Tax=Methylomonas koyamae TaxID=702114 RepID=A0A177PFC9_9GAMM|nr:MULTISPECIES: DUF5765 domain-containing protein [Methylomonas]NJA07016.1 hypothetical protein [Methylococcaceae bacterium WWC4]MDT4329629.1 DUF5765 domain-containing protein [Methylomonas sp. MV1]OAI28183.1 hypothetical protein A1355_17485 [Methylomonas koyamae]OHX38436.1 hypothetical protein BJL95_09045 [Methylomonas sp. LWB]WGS87197.1 DUF5765 domain-containing protein [Methylomonas sp. UP202]
MCFSADMSLGLGVAGLAAATVTVLDKDEAFWVRLARAYAIFHFSLMEFIQFFAYPVADQCGYGTNLLLSELSSVHISLQAFAIMPALATYSSDPAALKKAFIAGASLSGLFLVFGRLPNEWQLFGLEPNFIGRMNSCLFMGIYHIGYAISSAFGTLVTHGSLFALALSGFVWKHNWRIASYHFGMAMMTLFMPQWLFGVSTGEAAAMYCFYSIPITASFMPQFKKLFAARPDDWSGRFAKQQS